MMRFNLFGFNVNVYWMFWLMAALTSGAGNGNSPDALLLVLIWAAVLFVSILIHEIGHALAMRHFGDGRVEIVLYGFGGYAQGTRWQGRTEDIIVSAAGPFFSLVLGGLCWGIAQAAVFRYGWGRVVLEDFKYINLFWALVNLLPIIPLDGGRISQALYGPDRNYKALKLSMIAAGGMALFGVLYWHSLFTALFFGMLAYNNYRSLNGQSGIDWMRP